MAHTVYEGVYRAAAGIDKFLRANGRRSPVASLSLRNPERERPDLLVERPVNERHGNGAFTDSRGHAFDAAGPHGTARKHTGQARLEQVRRATQRPVRGGEVLRGQIGTGLDERLG